MSPAGHPACLLVVRLLYRATPVRITAHGLGDRMGLAAVASVEQIREF